VDRRAFLTAATAGALALRYDPAAFARRLGGTLVALVTADEESRVVVVGVPDGRIRGHITTPTGPRSIETVGLDAVVAHTAVGAVSVVDGRRLRVRRLIEGFEQPRYTAAAPDGRLAYVTDSGRGEVVVVDLELGRIVGRLALGGPARHITISPQGGWLWVAIGSSADRVAVLSLAERRRPRLERILAPPFLAHDVAYEPGGRRVWVSSGEQSSHDVLLYDVDKGRPGRRLHAGAPPQHITFVGNLAYISTGADGAVRVYSLLDGKLQRTTPLPLGSYNVQAADGRVVTPSLTRGTLCILDSRGRLLSERRVATSSHDACLVVAA
jgi:sugar lactone lactonase YvrE